MWPLNAPSVKGRPPRVHDSRRLRVAVEGLSVTMDTVMQIGDFVATANVRTVRRMLRALVEGDTVGGDAFVSRDFLDHDAPGADNSPPRVAPSSFAKASNGSTPYLPAWSLRGGR